LELTGSQPLPSWAIHETLSRVTDWPL
jgi:hypothetical protein